MSWLKHLLPRKNRRRQRKYPTYARPQPRLESKPGSEKKSAHRVPKKYTRSPRRRPFLKKLLRYSLITAAFVFAWFYLTLPDIDDLNKFTKAPSIIIKAENGQIIGSFGDVYGDYVAFEELPASLIDAVLATEDRNFYYHFGIDPFGILRATIANIRAGHVVQGGSTITQQVAKNVFLTPERSLGRKIREALLAIKLEWRFTKQDILSIYLNRVYLGAGSYGIDAASKRYFDKPAREMTLSESAIIAGLLKAPSRFSPTSNPELSRKRAEQVLLNMADAKYLTDTQAQKAREELTQSMSGRVRSSQSSLYFADWIMEQLPEYIGGIEEDVVVTTTLDTEMQVQADKAISEIMDKEGEKMKASQAALIAMTPNGAIRAMVGGRSYAESQFNRATQSLRQPGSSFKMFVYLAGLEAGLTPSSIFEDKPITIGKWQPKNYTGEYQGMMTLKEALTESINSIAVQVSEYAGLDHVINVATRLGITSNLEPLPSIALGATEVTLLELTNAYAHLAADGGIVYPYGIWQIETSKGEPLYQRKASHSGIVIRSDIVGMMNDMLMNVITSGTGRGAMIGRPAAGKTGTTSDYRDAWFIGYTPDLVAGVWVGNDDNLPMKKVTGGTLPAPIWREFMREALAHTPVQSLPTEAVSSPLPWQPDFSDGSSPDAQEPGQPHKDVELGKSFWDKLLH